MAATPALSEALLAKYEPVIGLEVHVQLLTASKIFCSCSTRFGDPPNYECLPGLPWHAGRFARVEPQGRRIRSAGRDGSPVPHQSRLRSSRARIISIPICPRATRSRNTTSRSPSMASSRSMIQNARCCPEKENRHHPPPPRRRRRQESARRLSRRRHKNRYRSQPHRRPTR